MASDHHRNCHYNCGDWSHNGLGKTALNGGFFLLRKALVLLLAICLLTATTLAVIPNANASTTVLATYSNVNSATVEQWTATANMTYFDADFTFKLVHNETQTSVVSVSFANASSSGYGVAVQFTETDSYKRITLKQFTAGVGYPIINTDVDALVDSNVTLKFRGNKATLYVEDEAVSPDIPIYDDIRFVGYSGYSLSWTGGFIEIKSAQTASSSIASYVGVIIVITLISALIGAIKIRRS